MQRCLLLVSVLWLGSMGCGSRREPEAIRPEASGATVATPLVVASEAEVEPEAERLMAIFRGERPSEELDEFYDVARIARRGLTDAMTRSRRDAHVQAAVDEHGGAANPLRRTLRRIGEGASLRVGFGRREGLLVLRLRLTVPGEGVTFVDLLFERAAEGVRVADLFSMHQARWLSASFTRAPRDATAVGAPITDPVAAQVDEFSQRVVAREYAAALEIYSQLPPGQREDPELLDLWLVASKFVDGGARYPAAVRRWLELQPDAPSAPLKRFDLALFEHDWDGAVAGLASVRAMFPDPYWLTVEAWVELRREDYERALELSERATREDPSLMQGPDWALLAALRLGRDEDAVRYAVMLRDRFQLDLEALAGESGYEGLAHLTVPGAAPELEGPRTPAVAWAGRR